jgi:hypothetical protein
VSKLTYNNSNIKTHSMFLPSNTENEAKWV